MQRLPVFDSQAQTGSSKHIHGTNSSQRLRQISHLFLLALLSGPGDYETGLGKSQITQINDLLTLALFKPGTVRVFHWFFCVRLAQIWHSKRISFQAESRREADTGGTLGGSSHAWLPDQGKSGHSRTVQQERHSTTKKSHSQCRSHADPRLWNQR